jgi:ribosomal protein S18 acetylase RimI-like enzyme
MAAPRIRRATAADLPAILALEEACFEPYRRASEASLRRSLRSPRQSFWLAEGGGRVLGLLVLWHFPRTLRVYDVATHPDARGQGVGHALMAHAEALARNEGAGRISLEAEEQDPHLVAWYRKQGFEVTARLPDFYHEGCSALRMVRRLA